MSTSILEHDEHDEQAERRTKFLANYQAACELVREACASGACRQPSEYLMPDSARVTDVHFQGSRFNGTHCLYVVPRLHAGTIDQATGDVVTDGLYRNFLGDPGLTTRFYQRLWQDFSQEEINAIAVEIADEPAELIRGQSREYQITRTLSASDLQETNEEIQRCEETAAAVRSGQFTMVIDEAGLALLPLASAIPEQSRPEVTSVQQTVLGRLMRFFKRG